MVQEFSRHNLGASRRAVICMLTGLAGSVALAACGGSNAATAATPSVSSTQTTSAAQTGSTVVTTALASSVMASAASAATSASAVASSATLAASTASSQATTAAAGVVTINHLDWWSPNTPVLVTFFNGNKADFEQKNPDVKVNYLFAASVDEVRQKWIVSTAGGVPPDTSQIDVTFIRDLMQASLFEPLDAYIAKSPDMAMSNFVASGLYYNQQGGHTYGIPFDGPQVLCIAYNTDHFQEAGLDPSKNFT